MIAERPLRVVEFAQAVGYSIATVRKKIFRKEIDSYKVGRIVLVPQTEVKRLLSDFRPRAKVVEVNGKVNADDN